MPALMMAASQVTPVALAFTRATSVLSGDCDGLGCPAIAAKRVEILGQDFYFCMHHWSEHRLRLLVHPPTRPLGALVGDAARS
jgi:hypothetical protein